MLVGIDGLNQKAPILDRGFNWECVSYIAPLSITPVVRLLAVPFELIALLPDDGR